MLSVYFLTEIIAVYCWNHTKHVNTSCWQTAEFLTVVAIINKGVYDISVTLYLFFSYGSTVPGEPRPPHFSRFRDHTPHSVGLLWMSEQPVAETST
jgi:hypothetical protein